MRIEEGSAPLAGAGRTRESSDGERDAARARHEAAGATPMDQVEQAPTRSETWWLMQRARSMATHSPASMQIPLPGEEGGARAPLGRASEGAAGPGAGQTEARMGRPGPGQTEVSGGMAGSGVGRTEAAVGGSGPRIGQAAATGDAAPAAHARGAELPEGFLGDWIEVARRNRGRIEPGMGSAALERNLRLALRDGGFAASSRHSRALAALDLRLTGPDALCSEGLRSALRAQVLSDARLRALPSEHAEALVEAMARLAEGQRVHATLRRFTPQVSPAHRADLAHFPPQEEGLRGEALSGALAALRSWEAAELSRIAESGARRRDPQRRLRESEIEQIAAFHEAALRRGWSAALPEGPLRQRYEGHLRANPGDIAGAWELVRRPMVERMQARVRHALAPPPLVEGMVNGLRGRAPDAPHLPWGSSGDR